MSHRFAIALTVSVVSVTVAATAPSPAVAADAKYPGDYCDTVGVPDFSSSLSRSTIRRGQPTTYTVHFHEPFNHVEWNVFVNGQESIGGIIHHEETRVIRVTLRPREDATVTWSGAVYCDAEGSHGDMAPDLSPQVVNVVQPRRPWNRIVQLQRSLLAEAQ